MTAAGRTSSSPHNAWTSTCSCTSRVAPPGTPSTSTTTPWAAGDILWVRAGQVHHWGAIGDIEGPVVMFGPHTVDERTRDLIRSAPGPPAEPLARGRPDGHTRPAGPRAADPQWRRPAARRAHTTYTRSRSPTPSPRSSSSSRSSSRPALTRRRRVRPTRPTPGSVTTSRNTSGAGTRSASTPTGWATRPAPSTVSPDSTPACPPRSSSTSASCSRRNGSSATPTRSVSEIAEQLGFDDASNFSSYFRRQTGNDTGRLSHPEPRPAGGRAALTAVIAEPAAPRRGALLTLFQPRMMPNGDGTGCLRLDKGSDLN